MIANRQPCPSDQRSRSSARPARHGEEKAIDKESFQIERKVFVLSLRENALGRFLRVTEDVGGRRDSIIVPASGLPEFARRVEEMARRAGEEESIGDPPEA